MTQVLFATDAVLSEAETHECWFVLHTRCNHERKVSRVCEYLGVRHYLPLRVEGEPSSQAAAVPLFPGYLFACADAAARNELISIGSVFRAIAVERPKSLLEELRQVDSTLSAWRGIASGPALAPGQRVRIWKGPLTGIEGLVAHRRFRRRRERLFLNVMVLGQAAILEIDSGCLWPIDDEWSTTGTQAVSGISDIAQKRVSA
jgi:transcription antitermination factor NusG